MRKFIKLIAICIIIFSPVLLSWVTFDNPAANVNHSAADELITYENDFENPPYPEWSFNTTKGTNWDFVDGNIRLINNEITVGLMDRVILGDFTISIDVLWEWDNTAGIVFHAQDFVNHIFVDLKPTGNGLRLRKAVGALSGFQLLTHVATTFEVDKFHRVEVSYNATNKSLTVIMNDEILLENYVITGGFDSGKIGIYGNWSPLRFDNILLTQPGYELEVINGSGSGTFAQGTSVEIVADAPPADKQFDRWTGDIATVADVNASSTTITMPATNTTVSAEYTDILDQTRFSLENHLDTTKITANPHKGLYHHYYDNGLWGYGGSVADITSVPGLDHLLIRLAWRFFEPSEGNFNWRYIDDLVATYEPLGYKFGFVFTAKETGITYATPKWVVDLGAKGQMVTIYGQQVWEPDYDDPIFLEKLTNFHTAVAERYQDEPWLAYVQVGSYGTWGEGHNHPASNMVAHNDVIKKHIDIYLNAYTNPNVRISMPDDVYGRSANRPDIKEYVESNGLFWTDHSVMVQWYLDQYPDTYSIHKPELFEDTWQTRPTHLELQHYPRVKQDGNWTVPNGIEKGASIVRGAVKLARATWLGYHGDARMWVTDNPEFSIQISNMLGYWYRLHHADIPQDVDAGSDQDFSIRIENIGVAPAYHQYQAQFKFQSSTDAGVAIINNSNNTTWMPDTAYTENYSVNIPAWLPVGTYDVKFKLFDDLDTKRNIDLALNNYIRDNDGFFTIGTITIENSDAIVVTEVSLSPTTFTMDMGETQQLTASVSPSDATNQNMSWSSSNPSAATVSSSGLVSGVAPGTAIITVTTESGNKTATSSVSVTDPQTNIAETDLSSNWLIYPNPVFEGEKIIIQGLNPAHGTRLHVVDFTGRTVLKQNFEAGSEISISNGLIKDSGIYFLIISSGDVARTLKLVVK